MLPVSSSKKWEEMKSMSEDEPVSLAVPDSENDFFPFQLMALYKTYSKADMRRFEQIVMKKYGNNLWMKSSRNEKLSRFKEVLEEHERETLGCIFELLHHNPMLVHVGTVDSRSRPHRRHGVESTENEPADGLSVQEYLSMLESNPSSVSIDFLA